MNSIAKESAGRKASANNVEEDAQPKPLQTKASPGAYTTGLTSIVTAIFNQKEMNRLFYESVVRTTRGPWQLIIVDNGSTDGSPEWFESLHDSRVKVIRNGGNYSYPYSNNRGLHEAEGDIVAFLNNDISLPTDWDTHMRQLLGHDGYEVLTLASNDFGAGHNDSHFHARLYKWVKYPLLKIFGPRKWVLKLMLRLTYGNFQKFAKKQLRKYGRRLDTGFAGSAVMATRKAIETLDIWDSRLQSSDFDLYLQTSKRWDTHGDIRPIAAAGGVYHHHFSRLTTRQSFPPFVDKSNLIQLADKWSQTDLKRYPFPNG